MLRIIIASSTWHCGGTSSGLDLSRRNDAAARSASVAGWFSACRCRCWLLRRAASDARFCPRGTRRRAVLEDLPPPPRERRPADLSSPAPPVAPAMPLPRLSCGSESGRGARERARRLGGFTEATDDERGW
jgi:hypothetical protein